MNEIFSQGHQKILFAQDEQCGLKTIIAIHDTTLGPAIGGTRIWNYETVEEALFDVMRLSQGMTMKNAACGLKNGGGKAVILGDAKTIKTKELLLAYGKIVDSLQGEYITAEDVNVNTSDIDLIHTVTNYCIGTSKISNDPAPFTARGVLFGMLAGAKEAFGSDSLENKKIHIQGLGNVGFELARLCKKQGAILHVFDIDEEKMKRAEKELDATRSSEEEILFGSCDILSCCALGCIINEENYQRLQCKLIAGSANNVLKDTHTGDLLQQRNILYLPDYIINAGGVINCAQESYGHYDLEDINKRIENIYETIEKIIHLSKKDKISTSAAADRYALSIIEQAKNKK